MIHIFDADSLWHLMNIKNIEVIDFVNSKFILTPNKVEFQRLYNKFFNEENANKNQAIDYAVDYESEQQSFFEMLLETNTSSSILEFYIYIINLLNKKIKMIHDVFIFLSELKRKAELSELNNLKELKEADVLYYELQDDIDAVNITLDEKEFSKTLQGLFIRELLISKKFNCILLKKVSL